MLQGNILISIPSLVHGFTNLETPYEKKSWIKENVLLCKQVHGKDFIKIEKSHAKEETAHQKADAMYTREKNIYIGVQTADCVPILMCGKDKNSKPIWIGAIHAGWRGTMQEIASLFLENILQEENNINRTPQTHSLSIVMGPSICSEHFLIQEDVARFFRHSPHLHKKEGDSFTLNLQKENERSIRNMLEKKGLSAQIELVKKCTYAKNYLPSWRKETHTKGKKRARIISFIGMQ